MTDWYSLTGSPAPASQGSSSTMRGEFALIAAAFAKLPAYSGHANEIAVINGGGTGMTTIAMLGVPQGGTGVATLTANGILLGNGTGAIQATAKPAAGEVLVGQAGAPVLQSGATLLATLGVNNTHSGDVSGGATLTIGANKVLLSMMEQRATQTFLGRNTAATGNVEELSVATAKTMLALAGTNSGDQTITLTGDVTGSGTGSFAATIASNAVTLAKMAQVATASILGRTSGGTGNVEVLTGAQALAIIGAPPTSRQVIAGAGLINGGALTADVTLDVGAGVGIIANANDVAVDRTNATTTNAVGYLDIPINSQSGNYTTVMADRGKCIYHPNGAGAGDVFTIDSNANVAYPIGTTITFANKDASSVSIAITADTLTLAGTTTTGTRTLAQNGIATAFKDTATSWLISGPGLS